MGASGLDDACVFILKPQQCLPKCGDCRQQLVFDYPYRRNVHGGGEGVVGALGHVDMVVRVQQLLTRKLIAPVCDDLVDIHIALGAAPGLPDGQREVPG
ncbi:hypothetical protein SDC9_192459 [bioreactor metagenome]|uniref:Uncharacterized protein n=1 Tax=bioreactor metagenome TaxID=1076179 RepID=A0A645I2B9_9ZZZZ